MMSSRVLIADDHAIFRRGLVEILGEMPNYKVIAQAGDGVQALDACRRHSPDLLLLDLNMPRLDGFGVLQQLKLTKSSRLRVAMLTIYNDEVYLARATALGAHGYMLKENAEEELMTCLDTISQGGIYTSPQLLGGAAARDLTQGLSTLSNAEKVVLSLLADQITSAAIADKLGLSKRTVENHRARIVQKLGLSGAGALLRFALEYRTFIE